jgi:hypothetical protein
VPQAADRYQFDPSELELTVTAPAEGVVLEPGPGPAGAEEAALGLRLHTAAYTELMALGSRGRGASSRKRRPRKSTRAEDSGTDRTT